MPGHPEVHTGPPLLTRAPRLAGLVALIALVGACGSGTAGPRADGDPSHPTTGGPADTLAAPTPPPATTPDASTGASPAPTTGRGTPNPTSSPTSADPAPSGYQSLPPVALPGLHPQPRSATTGGGQSLVGGSRTDVASGVDQPTVWSVAPRGDAQPATELPPTPGQQRSSVGLLTASGGEVLAAAGAGDPGLWLRDPAGTWRLLPSGASTFFLAIPTRGGGWLLLGSDGDGKPAVTSVDAQGRLGTREAHGLTGDASSPTSLLRLNSHRLVAVGGEHGAPAVSDDDGSTWTPTPALHAQDRPHAAVLPDGTVCAVSLDSTRAPADRAATSSDGVTWTPTGGQGSAVLGTVTDMVANAYAVFAAGTTPQGHVALWRTPDCRAWTTVALAEPAEVSSPLAVAASDDAVVVAAQVGTEGARVWRAAARR